MEINMNLDQILRSIAGYCHTNKIIPYDFTGDAFIIYILNENRTDEDLDFIARQLKVMIALSVVKACGTSLDFKVRYKGVNNEEYKKLMMKCLLKEV